MTNFPFDADIPDANNDPSADQPGMKINNNSTEQILSVDHVSFNSDNGGTHLQVNFCTNNIPPTPGSPGTPPLLQSIAFTQPGVAEPGQSEFIFQNSNAVNMLSAVKAFGNFTLIGAVGPVTANNSFNVASIAKTQANPAIYTVTLTAGSVHSDQPCFVFSGVPTGVVTAGTYSPIIYTYDKPSLTFTIYGLTAVGGFGGFFNFVVLEA